MNYSVTSLCTLLNGNIVVSGYEFTNSTYSNFLNVLNPTNDFLTKESSTLNSLNSNPYRVESLPNGNFISIKYNHFYIRNPTNGSIISGYFESNLDIRLSLVLQDNSNLVLSTDSEISIWNFNKKAKTRTLSSHRDSITCLIPFKDSRFITGSNDGKFI